MTASLLLSPWLCPLPPPLTRHLLNSASAADICAAAADGDLDAVRALLAGGVDPNAFRDDEGRTALFAAISEGHEGVALELLRHPGIDVSLGRSSSATEGGDEAGGRDVSPLCAAAHEGLSAVIEALLVHGRDSGIESGHVAAVNSATPDGRTPLMLAVGENHHEAAQILLSDAECDPNLADDSGCSPAWAAAEAGALEALEALLAHPELDINAPDSKGRSPLWIAAALGNTEALQGLLRHSATDLNRPDSDGLSPLHAAASRGHTGVIRELLVHGGARIDLNQLSGKQQTALGLAVSLGHVEAVRELLSCDLVECSGPIEGGGTALGVAALAGRAEVVEELLSCSRVDPCGKDEDGRSPLEVVEAALAADMGELGEMKLKPKLEEVQELLRAAMP